MTPNRTFQSAILASVLLVGGAACSRTAATSPADSTPAVAIEVAPAATDPQAPATDQPATPAPEPAPTPDPDPTPEPQPTPDPEPEPEPAPGDDPNGPNPAPNPDPGDLVEESDDPDPDPGPDPTIDLGVQIAEIDPSVFDGVVVAKLPACGLHLPIRGSAASVSSVAVDAFGDGTADDTVTSYYEVDAGQWRIRLVPSAGGVSEVTVSGVGPGFVEALGAVHVDTDDAEQVLAVVGSGASALVLGVFGADADGCLFQFTWHGSAEPVTFAVGATVGDMSGVQCHESDDWRYLSSISAVSNGPGTDTWNIYGTTALRESEQTLQAGDGIHVFGVSDGAAQLASVPTVNCPGITL